MAPARAPTDQSWRLGMARECLSIVDSLAINKTFFQKAWVLNVYPWSDGAIWCAKNSTNMGELQRLVVKLGPVFYRCSNENCARIVVARDQLSLVIFILFSNIQRFLQIWYCSRHYLCPALQFVVNAIRYSFCFCKKLFFKHQILKTKNFNCILQKVNREMMVVDDSTTSHKRQVENKIMERLENQLGLTNLNCCQPTVMMYCRADIDKWLMKVSNSLDIIGTEIHQSNLISPKSIKPSTEFRKQLNEFKEKRTLLMEFAAIGKPNCLYVCTVWIVCMITELRKK